MKTILIVEDDPVSRKIYRRQLESFPNDEWRVVECALGEEGLKLCSETLFDCIVLDYHLPDLDGLEFLKLFSHKNKQAAPVIMLTSERESGLGARALRAGAQDFLIKGTFNKELLCQCILNAIEKLLLVKELEDRRQLYNDLLEEVEATGFEDERLKALLSIDVKQNDRIPSGKAKAIRILVIDDDEDDRFLITELLQESQPRVEVVNCSNLQDAIKLLQQQRWHCVLLDYMLNPGTAEDILSLWSVLPPFPIIINSGLSDFHIATRLFRDGATDFLIKEEITAGMLWYRIEEGMKRHNLLLRGKKVQALKEKHARELHHIAFELDDHAAQDGIYQTLMDQTDDFIFVVDRTTALVEEENANVGSLLKFGPSKDHPYYFYWVDASLQSEKSWCKMLSNLESESPYLYETELKAKMGHRIAVKMKIKGFEQDGNAKIMVVAHDISKQKRIEDELRNLALTDPLTQISNRRSLDEKMDELWRLLVREKRPLSLLMIDVDHFKRYNDAAGHLMGDQCLKSIAMLLREVINRPQDFVARYGGEEFVVLLPFTDLAGGEVICQRIQKEIAALELIHPDSPTSPLVTLSIGLYSGIPTTEMLPEHFFEKADLCLYEAKEKGRNLIIGNSV